MLRWPWVTLAETRRGWGGGGGGGRGGGLGGGRGGEREILAVVAQSDLSRSHASWQGGGGGGGGAARVATPNDCEAPMNF